MKTMAAGWVFLWVLGSFAQQEAPSTIYVGNGYFSGEYYDFFSDEAGSNQIYMSNLVFYEGGTYTFERLSGVNNHPFYLSDIQNNGTYHYGTLSFSLETTASISRSHGIQDGESFSFTIPENYQNDLHYYCTVFSHTSMVGGLSISEAPSYVAADRLIITEVKRASDMLEVTYFGTEAGLLEQDVTLTNVLGDVVTVAANTTFEGGESKLFSTPLEGADHMMLVALDAMNPAHWVDGSDYSNWGLFFDLQRVLDPVPDVVQGTIVIGLETVATNLSHPIGLVDPNDGSGRKFIFEQTGQVRVLESDGSVAAEPFMDVSTNLISLVLDSIGYDERGLLGLVLDSDFSENGTLYYYASLPTNAPVDYAFPSGTSIDHHSAVMERVYVDSNNNNLFDGADTYSERELLRFEQPVAESFSYIGSNHNSGHLAFDSNGYLMVSIGDGGDRDDTGNGHGPIGNGADPSNIWGSIIRIDPAGNNSANGAYGIPADNPFVNSSALSEAPATLYVGNGYFSGEYYDFFGDAAGTERLYMSDLVFYEGSTYTFEKISGGSHPFYLSDLPKGNGSYHYGTLSLTLSSSATISQSDGIVSGESFSVTIPTGYQNDLHYYCTRSSHTVMVGAISTAVRPNLEEIYAYGLRNPWTFSQDPVSGVIYSADSGQDTIQEVNVIVAGGNYGWRAKEGSYLFDPVSCTVGTLTNAPALTGLVDPLVEYDHGQGYANVIGGHVYRGSQIPALQGMYVCGDYGPFTPPGELFYVDTTVAEPVLKRFQIGAVDRELITDVRGFSLDADGELYFVGNGAGESGLYKIIPVVQLDIAVDSQIKITVRGDEESSLSVVHAGTVEGLSSGTTNPVISADGVLAYPIESQRFYKAIAE